jgi:tetratricopeptide (TPR) repeat protein
MRLRLCAGLVLWAVPAAAQPLPPAETRARALERAAAEAAAGRQAEAERLLRAAAERFQSVEALLRLARLQSTRKDAAGALEALRRALTLAPNSEEVLSAYAQVSLAVRAPVPALLALEPLTRMCPGVAQYNYLFGVALMQAGDMPAAVEPLQQAQQLEPDRALTLIALGLALNGRKLFADARPHLLRALELEPDNVEALAALAEAEEGLDDLAPAEAHAQRALSRAPQHVTAQLVVGLVRMKQQRYAEARDAFERAVRAAPDSSKAHYQLSLAYARLGDEARSRQHLESYRRAQNEIEERLARLRSETGLAPSAAGMGP